MKIKIWRTRTAWCWYCPVCDKTWRNRHRPEYVKLERLSPTDPRRVPAFQRAHKAVRRHLRRFHGGEVSSGTCVVPLVGGPHGGSHVGLKVADPSMLPRLPALAFDHWYVYQLARDEGGRWVYLWDTKALSPQQIMRAR